MAMKPAAEPREIISPEGVEERLVKELIVRITLTGGGKYRVYMIVESAEKGGLDIHPSSIHDTKDAAEKKAGGMMMVFGGMIIDPVNTLRTVLRMPKDGEDD